MIARGRVFGTRRRVFEARRRVFETHEGYHVRMNTYKKQEPHPALHRTPLLIKATVVYTSLKIQPNAGFHRLALGC
ncbi:MAG: hypothetical protein HC773_05760 [Scytonema sp. CRU_2_7]|nr:hypothetical protein [Scytonema sp. CRU_2_7]